MGWLWAILPMDRLAWTWLGQYLALTMGSPGHGLGLPFAELAVVSVGHRLLWP
jgi:hypothetical protein